MTELRQGIVGRLLAVALLTLVMAGSAGSVGCAVNPATGKRNLNFIGEEQELALGVEAAPGFLKEYGGDIPSPVILDYVRSIGQRLAAESERAALPWEFHVVDSSVLNAFALPGGKVFISRGLLVRFENEAMLAGVLGHEIGHVTAQHIGQQISQAMVVQGIGAAIGVAAEETEKEYLKVLGLGVQAGGAVYLLKFGRDQESQADSLGLRYMTRLGYDPMGQVAVMKVLRDASAGAGGQLEILATHPLPDTRIKRLEDEINKRYYKPGKAGAYVTHEQRFKTTVLDNLKKLPPAKHGR